MLTAALGRSGQTSFGEGGFVQERGYNYGVGSLLHRRIPTG